ncbi:S-layer homology domain-containing protein [Paenibacillus sp. FA6]|uniref:S-layer homology domain-containing protein n=1 Tax=Paenibacillus sp. FA6 TaxID=3413029 RepID=UPI003F65D702
MVNLSMKRSLLLLVTALLCILPIWSKSVHADRHEEYGELVVSISVDGDWIEQGYLTYGRFVSEKSLQLKGTQADKPAVIRIMQQGGGKSHLDSVLLGTQSPIEVNGDTAASVRKLAAADQDLINIEASGVILQFASGNPGSILKIDGRVEPEVISKIPFHYPTSNLYKEFDLNSEYYTYTLNSFRGNQVMDGQLNEISSQAPFFQQYTVPDSGHPEGITYGWVWNDDDNLYVAIDFTSDNTFDGDADYTKVYVKTNSGAKEFKASVSDTAWGQPFFTYTDKVSYEHKVYEYKIPLKNLEIAADQTELQLGFAAYGTAAAGNATDNDQTHVGIDGRDISVQWLESNHAGSWSNGIRQDFTFDIYILPSGETRNLAIHKPIASVLHGPDPKDWTWNWTGYSTDNLDSTGTQLAGGEYEVSIYLNYSAVDGNWTAAGSKPIKLRSDVDVSKFSVVDNYTGTQDQLQSTPNAVGANLPVTAYLWNDSNSNGAVDSNELEPPILLGTSAADGSVAAADIGDLRNGTYKFVITSTDKGTESTKDAAHAVTVYLYNNALPVQVTLDSISSSNPTPGVAKVGDTVTVTFTTDRGLSGWTEVFIGYSGLATPLKSVGDNVYSGSYTFTASDSEGEVAIVISAVGLDYTYNTIWALTDSSGNSVTFDKTAPTGTLSINGGAATTDSVSVTLTVTGEDPDGIGTIILSRAEKQPIQIASTNHLILRELGASMKLAAALPPSVPGTGNVEMLISNDEVSWGKWEPVAGMKTWTLSAGNGIKTVYMKLKDAAGNETATVITASIEMRLLESPSYEGSDSYQQSEPIKKDEKPEVEKPEVEKQHKAYISGYPDGTFGPDNSITRAEMATLLFRTSEKAANKAHITYTDVASTYWAQEAIEQVTKMGLMEGYADGSFKRERMITRAEVALILSKLSSNGLNGGESFSDVKGHWAQTTIEQLKMTGIISGYPDGTFRPEQTLKRAEVVGMLNRLLGRGPLTTMAARWSDVPNDHWAFGEIQEASIDHASGQEVNRK